MCFCKKTKLYHCYTPIIQCVFARIASITSADHTVNYLTRIKTFFTIKPTRCRDINGTARTED